jgi:hypothetical protein
MRRALRLSVVLIALVVGLASIGVGAAQGHAPPAGVVVICAGGDIVTVRVDAQGEPVETQRPCPDCVLVLHALPGMPPICPCRPVPRADRRQALGQTQHLPGLPVDMPGARAPPERA